MKKTLFALLMAIPMLFTACGKDDSNTSNGATVAIDFEKLNSWIGLSKTTVDNELKQMGFTEGGLDKGSINYTYMDQASMVYVICTITSDDNGIVRRTGATQFTVANSFNGTLATFQKYVQQERQLFGSPVETSGEIAWDDTDDDNNAIDGRESYDSYEDFASAASSMGSHRYLEFYWLDKYSDISAILYATYDNMREGSSATQMVSLGVVDNTYSPR